MQLKADDYQIISLIALIIIFSICERLWPARPVDRYKDLKLNVLSFAVMLLVNRVATYAILATVGDATPQFLQGTAAWLRGLPSPVRLIMAVFIVDFTIYWIHRAQHRYGFMWRTHAWH